MAATFSGQRTVTTAGTAVRLSAATKLINGPLMVKALDTNTGVVALGGVAGDVTVSNGLRLSASESIVFEWVGDLYNVWLDSAVNGEGVSWIQLNA
jgi:hypothetical protein